MQNFSLGVAAFALVALVAILIVGQDDGEPIELLYFAPLPALDSFDSGAQQLQAQYTPPPQQQQAYIQPRAASLQQAQQQQQQEAYIQPRAASLQQTPQQQQQAYIQPRAASLQQTPQQQQQAYIQPRIASLQQTPQQQQAKLQPQSQSPAKPMKKSSEGNIRAIVAAAKAAAKRERIAQEKYSRAQQQQLSHSSNSQNSVQSREIESLGLKAPRAKLVIARGTSDLSEDSPETVVEYIPSDPSRKPIEYVEGENNIQQPQEQLVNIAQQPQKQQVNLAAQQQIQPVVEVAQAQKQAKSAPKKVVQSKGVIFTDPTLASAEARMQSIEADLERRVEDQERRKKAAAIVERKKKSLAASVATSKPTAAKTIAIKKPVLAKKQKQAVTKKKAEMNAPIPSNKALNQLEIVSKQLSQIESQMSGKGAKKSQKKAKTLTPQQKLQASIYKQLESLKKTILKRIKREKSQLGDKSIKFPSSRETVKMAHVDKNVGGIVGFTAEDKKIAERFLGDDPIKVRYPKVIAQKPTAATDNDIETIHISYPDFDDVNIVHKVKEPLPQKKAQVKKQSAHNDNDHSVFDFM